MGDAIPVVERLDTELRLVSPGTTTKTAPIVPVSGNVADRMDDTPTTFNPKKRGRETTLMDARKQAEIDLAGPDLPPDGTGIVANVVYGADYTDGTYDDPMAKGDDTAAPEPEVADVIMTDVVSGGHTALAVRSFSRPAAPAFPLKVDDAPESALESEPEASLDDDRVFILYATSSTRRPFDPEAAYLVEGSFDHFVKDLPRRCIVVKRNPETPLGQEQNVDLAIQDTWAQSVTVASVLGLQKLSLTMKVTPGDQNNRQTAVVSSFEAVVKADARDLTFESQNANTAVGISTSQELVVLDDYGMLVLGLSGQVKELTLFEILDVFGPSWLKIDTGGQIPFDQGALSKFNFKLVPEGGRNTLSFVNDSVSTTYLRMQFDMTGNVHELITWLKSKGLFPVNSLPEKAVKEVRFSCLRTATSDLRGNRIMSSVNSEVSLSATINFGKEIGDVQFVLVFEPGNTTLRARFEKLTAGVVFSWIKDEIIGAQDEVSGDDMKETNVTDSLPGKPDLKVVEVELQVSKQRKLSCSLLLQLDLLGAIFQTRLAYPEFSISAQLWTSIPRTDEKIKYLPWYEPFEQIKPFVDVQRLKGTMDMEQIVKDMEGDATVAVTEPPDRSLFTLEEVQLFAGRVGGRGLRVDIFASIRFGPPPATDVPIPWPKMFSARIVYEKGPNPWSLDLNGEIALVSRNATTGVVKTPITLALGVTYSSGVWVFTGSVQQLSFGELYQFFDADAQDSVMDILEDISITGLGVTYTHGPVQEGIMTKKLVAGGTLRINPFYLDIIYTYRQQTDIAKKTSTSEWTLITRAGPVKRAEEGPVGLIDMLETFSGGEDDSELFELLREIPFLNEIEIQTTAGGSEDSPVDFRVSSSPKAIIMTFKVQVLIGSMVFSFIFVQYKYKKPVPERGQPIPPAPVGTPANPRLKDLKRYIRLRIDKLPRLKKIPIVGDIVAPVDAIDYVYVQDLKTGTGFTANEVTEMNQVRKSSRHCSTLS